jgi:Holliday junction resolvasome RuvABC endonuclease subunit
MPITVGIDPGLTGAIAVWDGGMWVCKVPTVKLDHSRRELDIAGVNHWLDLFGEITLAAIEKVNADPHFGAASSFTFGKTFGQLLALLVLRGIPTVRVSPQTWKKSILVGTKKDKEAAIAYVRQRYPDLNNLSHDEADAVCLCEYARKETA